jgi:hypothetical protein
MAKQNAVSAAVSATAGNVKNGLETFVLQYTDKDGKPQTVTKVIDHSLADKARAAMAGAALADSTWSETFADWVAAFWPKYEPASTDKTSDITTALRGSNEYQQLYRFLTEMHPKFAVAEAYRAEMLAAEKGSMIAEEKKILWENALDLCRAVANTQAKTIVRYFAAENGADKADSERTLPSARSLIEAFIQDCTDRLAKPRGPLKDETEKQTLRNAQHALRMVLQGTPVFEPQVAGKITRAPATEATKGKTISAAEYEASLAVEKA